ncbi:MAG: DUF4386 family protein [Bacteroidetes bacterium]|nr:DUF4386 family protein [Bacteroidota bacterium]
MGFLLLFAGICYSGLSAAKAMMPSYADQVAAAEMILSLPMALAEILLAIWLIVKGGKGSSE